jgi:iron complex outermembrane receptor protein
MERQYFKKLSLFLFFAMLANAVIAQTGSISGRVTDEANEPIFGASVVLQGTSLATSTDVDGNYILSSIPMGTQTVIIRYVGYLNQEKQVNVSEHTVLNFQLAIDDQLLSEVVVVGYGTQKKSDLTGAIASVSADDFQQGAITTPEQLISGKIAGVAITSNSGAPGAGSTIRIRGGASLNASNDPLIVIDGVPVSNSSISGAANPLNLINPNDIENFTVLKDASATAIYGSRASNGVILITTKKGVSGKPKINFSTQYSIATPYKRADVLSADQFRDFVNANGSATFRNLLGEANTDWQDQIYHNAGSTDNNISIAGSLKNLPYRVSVGYLNQDGILKTGNLDRTTASINLSPTLLNNHLKVNLNVKGTYSKNRFANEDAIGAAVSFDPTQPVYSGNDNYGGYYEWLDPDPTSATGIKQLAPRNPLSLLNQRKDRSTVQRSIGNIQLDYSLPFLPELHANLNLGYDISKGEGTIIIPESAAASYRRFQDDNQNFYSGVNNQYLQTQQNQLLEFYLNYAQDIPSVNSRLDVVAGYAYQAFSTTNHNYADYSFDGKLRPGSEPLYPFDKPENRLISFYGRVNYSINSRYLFTGTVRTDGSSRFSPENRWSTFPSAAFAWRVIDEPFMENSKALSDLKLRLGYGVTGQQEGIGNYDYISYYNLSSGTAQYQFGDNFYNMYRPGGYYFNRKWEQTATSNIGIDYGFLGNRITGSLDLYYKKTTDLLNEIGQSAGTNFSNKIIANVGSMENKGVEFGIHAQAIKKEDFNWDIGFNVTYNKNEITKLTIEDNPTSPGNRYGGISGGTGQTVQIFSVNYPRGSFYAYQQVYGEDGIPLDGVFVDRNEDGLINENDLYHYQNSDPKLYFGLSSNLNYKKWTAGFALRASYDNYIYNNVFSNTGITRNILNPLVYLNNGSTNLLESHISGNINGDRVLLSDYYVQNGSFLRMDNINIGYTLGKLFSNAGDLNIGFTVQNAFTVTKYKGVDPEIGNGIDNNFYPRPRTYVLGLNLAF